MQKIQNCALVGLLLLGMGTQVQAQQLQKGWQVGAALPIALNGLKDWTNEPILGLCVDGAYVMPISGDKAWFRAGLGLNYFPGKAKKIAAFQGYMEDGQLVWDNDEIESWKDDTRTISLTGIQINADLIIPLGSTNLSLVTGVSLNAWHKKVSGKYPHDWALISGGNREGGYWGGGEWQWYDNQWNWIDWYWVDIEAYNPYPIDRLGRDNNFSGTVKNAFGRLGLRLGLEYAINDKFTIAATFQMAELGTDNEFLDRKFRVDYDSDGKEVPGSENKLSGQQNVNPSWIQIGVRYRF